MNAYFFRSQSDQFGIYVVCLFKNRAMAEEVSSHHDIFLLCNQYKKFVKLNETRRIYCIFRTWTIKTGAVVTNSSVTTFSF